MRSKVVISAAVLALAILYPAVYFHYKSGEVALPAEPVAVSEADTNAAPSALPPILKRASGGAAAQAEGLAVQESADTNLSHDEYVTKRKSDLYEMGMRNAPASLKTILSETRNPDQEIRQAALSAILYFGSKDAIPTLQNNLNLATDLEEKMEIQKAIDFLQLPHLGEDSASTAQSGSPN